MSRIAKSAPGSATLIICFVASSTVGLASASGQGHGTIKPRVRAPRVHYASVPVRACPSWYASSGAGTHFPKIPRWKVIAIPGDLTDQVAVYTDTRQYIEVLGPNGWNCAGTFGNGPLAFTIYPPSEKEPGLVAQQGGQQKRTSRVGINFVGYGASVALWQLVCPYFRTARIDLYGYERVPSSVCRIPHKEHVVSVDTQLKRVDDPPHVAGDNYPSGGTDWALGNAFFYAHRGASSYLMTCTLATRVHALCYASLARFQALWIRGSQS